MSSPTRKTDQWGYTSTQQVTITIQGANDAATVSQVTGSIAAYDFENGSGNAPSTVSGGPAMTVGSGVTYKHLGGSIHRFDRTVIQQRCGEWNNPACFIVFDPQRRGEQRVQLQRLGSL